jgi:hypothetical protein
LSALSKLKKFRISKKVKSIPMYLINRLNNVSEFLC